MDKRERVIRTLEHEEADKIPIYYLGMERSGTTYEIFKKSPEYRAAKKWVFMAHDITVQRFFNVDACHGDPFPKLKLSTLRTLIKPPKEFPDYRLGYLGRLFKRVKNEKTGKPYIWYVGGYFTSEEIIHDHWGKFGKPSENIAGQVLYKRRIWDSWVKRHEKYFYPIATLPIAMHEALFEGMGAAAMAKFMRKKPHLVHEVMDEYTTVNYEILSRYADMGVEIVFSFDDLGQKNRSILSPKHFREFILPYYRKLYQKAKKHGMFYIQHSCGYIDDFLPDMVDAGLTGIQSLEPAAGVDLAHLKETLGDRVTFLGGMDSSRVLSFGTPKDVEEDVKKCINAAGHGGGYFAGPSHDILNVPWKNLMALRAAIEKYRNYPLRFV